jgi:hypothetical protein
MAWTREITAGMRMAFCTEDNMQDDQDMDGCKQTE